MKRSQRKKQSRNKSRSKSRDKRRNKGRFFLTVLFVSAVVFMWVWMGLAGRPDPYAVRGAFKEGGGKSSYFDKGIKSSHPLYLKAEDITGTGAGTILPSDRIDINTPEQYFTIQKIDDDIYQNINGKSYRENDAVSLEELRYLKLLHYNYEHEIQVGELIVNEKIAEDCRAVFLELFEQEYEIQSMYLVDRYWTGDSGESDTNSIEHNNTSAFHYRVITGGNTLSEHALGYAIDVNPLQNPYVHLDKNGNPTQYYKDMELYLNRASGAGHMITHEDICYQTFIKYGFSWGGDWKNPKDYQHFEKSVE